MLIFGLSVWGVMWDEDQQRDLALFVSLLFAYDSIVFGEATIEGANIIKSIIEEYEGCSSQQFNLDKSLIYYGSHVPPHSRDQITSLLGVGNTSSLRNMYACRWWWGEIWNKLFKGLLTEASSMDGWSTKFLLQGGKLSLLSLFYKLYLRVLCLVSYCQALYVNKWKWSWLNIGGRRDQIRMESIGSLGLNCTVLCCWEVWCFTILPSLIWRF